MTAKASVFIATSLDGFIARPDGSIDWLDRANATIPDGEDCGYNAFIETVDVIVMGRNTFEHVLTFGEWPYGDKKVIVLSRQGVVVPDSIGQSSLLTNEKTVSTSTEAPESLVERLSSEGAQHMYIDGGQTIQSFLSAGLLTELIITVIPVLLGMGKPLFGSLLRSDILLEHVSTTTYDFGFVQSKYRVVKSL